MRFRMTDVSVKLCAVQLMVGEGECQSVLPDSFLTSAKKGNTFRQQFFLWANFSPQMLLEHMERSSNVVHMLAGDWNSRNGKDGGEGA